LPATPSTMFNKFGKEKGNIKEAKIRITNFIK
jgi:hypothetical protein